MATDEKWYFTKEQLANTPSRKCGIDGDKELSYRQQAANFIQDMGQRLMVSQLCINTAIVYMHRFYVFHSLTHFSRNSMASAALFLAAKVEEQPRKLEHVIKMAYMCLHKDMPHPQQTLDPKSDQYHELAQDLVCNENILLQTLGFDVAIDHPHTHVVRCCHLVKASKDLAQTSYFMASNSLHLTTMCLQYKPTIVACFCIHLACKWSNWEIPQSNEGKDWFWYVDKSVTSELLGQLTGEFLHIFDKCPSRLKRKIRSISANQSPSITPSQTMKSPFDMEPRKVQSPANPDGSLTFLSNRTEMDVGKKSSTSQSSRVVDYREYREKKDRERLEREKAVATAASSALNTDPNKHHSHHHKQSSTSGIAIPGKHSSSSTSIKQTAHHNHHHSSRQDVKSSSQMIQRHTSGSSNSSSASGGARELLREKQRIQREYSNLSSSGYSSHNHSLDNLLDAGISQDLQTTHPPEKLNNIIHKTHSNDSRHGKQHQKEAKIYSKYADPAAAKTSRKDPIEHRTEEVRKLIEKPLPPPPKPRPEVIQEEYAAMMLKSSHHPSKYQQPQKPTPNVSTSQASLPSLGPESKIMNVGQTAFTTEKSPNAPVSAAQISQKSLSAAKSSQAKNGNICTSATSSFSLVNNYDEPKVEKKPREENSILPNKHRSLFSPEKSITPDAKESHSQRIKQKQRTSPIVSKQENHLPSVNVQMDPMKQRSTNNSTSISTQKQHRLTLDPISGLDHDAKQQQQQENHSRRLMSNFSLSDSSRVSNNRVPDLVQSIKDNSKSLPAQVDVKPIPELTKPLDNIMPTNQRVKAQPTQQNQVLSNGLHSSLIKQEFSLIDPLNFIVKQELPEELLSNDISADFMFPKQEQKVNYLSYHEPAVKQDFGIKQESGLKQEPSARQNSFSPLKTAQSINALLQENLGSMSPILQVPSFEQQQSQSVEEDKEPLLPSTVDMSELVEPIHCAIEIPVMTTSAPMPVVTTTVVTSAPIVEEKKSEHHKSEKKKKEKKHKHKEKDKSKDKHKHKHKEKDKDKHRRDKNDREKDKTDDGNSASGNSATLGAVPIKITIPKDKLNLSADSIGTSASSTPSSGLKIKIPKERLKGSDVTAQQPSQSQAQQQASVPQPQAPLKIKIRTDALARNTSGELQPGTGKLHQQQLPQQQPDGASRKRERSDVSDSSAVLGAPPSKKILPPHHQQLQQQPQRPNERQNGRHGSYNSNKPERLYDVDVSSGEAVEGHPKNFVPTSYGSFPNYY